MHDTLTKNLDLRIRNIVRNIDPQWTVQDFRIKKDENPQHIHIFFDLVVPFEEKRSASEIEPLIADELKNKQYYRLEMRVVHPYR